MSESEGSVLSWPGPRPPGPRPPGPWGRPPTGPWPPGPWPPGPGPFPQPPDVFSAFAWLAKNYQESQAAKAFLRMMIQDLIAEDPTFLANAQATVGVTDGSAAQPGMVGEFIMLRSTIVYQVGDTSAVVSLGALPPGDWDCQAYAWPESTVTAVGFRLNPVPVGFSDALSVAAFDAGTQQELVLVSYSARALTNVPSLIAFGYDISSTAASNMILTFTARRRR